MSIYYRQGDVGLRRIAAPAKATRGKPVAEGRLVLAYCEVTGHAHTLTGAVAEFTIDGQRVVWVEAPAPLEHQEHDRQDIQPGWYVVENQVQLTDDDEVRQVLD